MLRDTPASRAGGDSATATSGPEPLGDVSHCIGRSREEDGLGGVEGCRVAPNMGNILMLVGGFSTTTLNLWRTNR